MEPIVVYYSYTGNTEKVARRVADAYVETVKTSAAT